QFSLSPPPDWTMNQGYTAVAVSPDGRNIVYAAVSKTGEFSLWLRPLDGLDARRLIGTASQDGSMFWSWDSESLVFHGDDGKLRRLDIAGGPSIAMTDPIPRWTM